jgi:hypothetical protein
MKMTIICVVMLAAFQAMPQHIPVEMMFGHAGYYYQHSIQSSGSTRVSFLNTSSLYWFHNKGGTEFMSQSYLSYRINDWIKISAGTFYATVPGLAASVHMQLRWEGKRWSFLLVPRVDLRSQPSYEIFTICELRQPLSGKLSLCIRTQAMFSCNLAQHNRSYQFVRVGIAKKNVQCGMAANFDAYGNDLVYRNNYGMYIRRLF